MMPPHTRDKDGIARGQFNGLSRLQGLTKFRIALIIGRIKVYQADGLPSRCNVQRSDIEIVELIWWEQDKPSAPGHRAGDIGRKVIVCGDAAAIAYPDADNWISLAEIEIIMLAKPRQPVIDIG